jgi:hypothetical protein
MIAENLKLFFQLYVRPRAALSGIIDEGSFFFGVALVVLLSLASNVPNATRFAGAMARVGHAPATSPKADAARVRDDIEEAFEGPRVPALLATVVGAFGQSSLFSVAGLVLLYVPALIFVMTIADRRAGSFSTALARDYGQLAPCMLLSWAAAHLPFLLVALGLSVRPEPWAWFASLAVPTLGGIGYFVILMTLAVRLTYGTGVVPAFLSASLALVVLPFAPFLGILASPFALYWAFIYLRGDIGDIQRMFGSRRSFRRHLEAATINPRDAEAHYQLGLIHQHRRQYPEAIARFEKAIEIDRSEIDAHYQLGRIAREQGRQADAIRHFEPVVAKDPKHSRHEIWREIGATYIEAGDFANARPMLERYVENRPYDPEGLFWLGLVLKKAGEAEKSREMQARCIEASKTAPDYRKGELRHWRKRAQQEL